MDGGLRGLRGEEPGAQHNVREYGGNDHECNEDDSGFETGEAAFVCVEDLHDSQYSNKKTPEEPLLWGKTT